MKSIRRSIRAIFSFALLTLWACGPASSAPVTDTPMIPSIEITEPHDVTATVEATQALFPTVQVVYPYYLPLVTKPDVTPETINGVTVKINWAYADESRISINYSIKGLDLPEESMLDASVVHIYSNTVPDIGYGGGSWGNQPMEDGVITGNIDQFFAYGDLKADEHPSMDLSVEIPINSASTAFLPHPTGGSQTSVPEIGTFRFHFDVPVLKGIKLENLDQTVTANDVAMTLKTFVLNPSYAQALICFEMPSAVDWGLSASTINMAGKDYPLVGFGLIEGTSGKNFTLNDPERCSSVGFNVPFDGSLQSITLTVPKLISSVPEVITKERVTEANQRLSDAGIEFDYQMADHGGNIVILKRPAGAPDMEIYPLIWDALADQYEGPWVFTVALK